jgi:uncharacterized protein (TIGR03437 family)
MRVSGLSLPLLVFSSLIPAQTLTFVNGQAARAVFGQPAFSYGSCVNADCSGASGANQQLLGGPQGLAWANVNGTPELFVADSNWIGATPSNNRIMVFNTSQLPDIHADVSTFTANNNSLCPLCGYQAAFELGQQDFTHNAPGVNNVPYTASGSSTLQGYMNLPTGVASDGNVLAVSDTNNNRVLIWTTVPQNSGTAPNVVLGQTSFTNGPGSSCPGQNAASQTCLRGPQGLWIQNGKLFVADTLNNRVLIWNSIPTSNNQPADIILGQPSFSSLNSPATTVNPTVAANQLYQPVSVTSDGTRLYVADLGSNRVLIWNSIPTSNDQPADVVVGQPDLTSGISNNTRALCASVGTDSAGNPEYPDRCAATLSMPRYALSDGNKLFIADGGNDRVLVFNSVPTTNGASADNVLGQPDFFGDIVTNQQATIISTTVDITGSVDTIPSPMALAYDGTNLYVSDPSNRRVLVYSPGDTVLQPHSILNAASRVIRQTGFVQINGTITANDTVTITIASKGYTYTVKSNDTLQSIAKGLIAIINANGGDPNVIAITGPQTNTVFLDARNTNIGLNSIALAASVSSNATETVQASGSYLTGGNAAMLAPGALVEIDGINLADNTYDPCNLNTSTDTCQNPTAWLPTSLGGAEVSIDGIQSPLMKVSPSQIITEVPFSFTDRDSSSVFVRTQHGDGSVTVTNASPINIAAASPGLFQQPNAPQPAPAFAALHAAAASATIDLEGTVQAGDTATITIAGTSHSYTVQSSDTLATIINGLVNAINTPGDPNVVASSGGLFNRVVLTAKQPTASVSISTATAAAPGKSGAAITLTAYTNATCCANAGTGLVTTANPAVPNETITFTGTGLGVLAAGFASAGVPYWDVVPNTVANSVNATVNSETGQVVNAGIPRDSVGIYQIQVIMPGDLPANANTPVYIAQNAFISNTVTIPVSTSPGTPAPPSNSGALTASPNPVPQNASGLGITTLSWNATSNSVEIHVNSPNGPLFAAGGATGSATTGPWVTNGMTFFLQDATQGTTTSSANTLATLTVQLGGASLSANPNPILIPSGTTGQTTLSWMAPGHSSISIFQGSTSGPLVTSSNSAYGSFTTPSNVTDGTTFVMIDPANPSAQLATTTVNVKTIAGTLTANPDPTPIVAGTPYGQTTLSWQAPNSSTVEIHVGSPGGALFTRGDNTGSATTGTWVTSGMTFFLQDATSGDVNSYTNTLATVTMQLTGDTQPSLTATPNPAQAGNGGYAQTTLNWWAPNAIALEVHVGAPDGPLLAVSGPSGSATTGPWVTNGTTFYLQDASTGASTSPSNTLATVTVSVQ